MSCSRFGLSAALGALAGILIAPITLTHYEVGVMLGPQGLRRRHPRRARHPARRPRRRPRLGVVEAMSAGYLSSAYKDAVAFVIILRC